MVGDFEQLFITAWNAWDGFRFSSAVLKEGVYAAPGEVVISVVYFY